MEKMGLLGKLKVGVMYLVWEDILQVIFSFLKDNLEIEDNGNRSEVVNIYGGIILF